MRILFAAFALLAALSPEGLRAEVGKWTSGGPYGAPVSNLAAHPSNPSTVYAPAWHFNPHGYRPLYKSVDAGASWAPTGLVGFFELVVPTSDGSVAYATTNGNVSATLHRTRDGGESWVEREGPGGRFVSATVDPNDPMTLYAVTVAGFFRTTNGGDSWEQLEKPGVSGATAVIAVDPVNSTVLYASVTSAQDAGVYRSSDRGASWNPTNLREPTFVLLFDQRNPARLFAITNSGLHVTTNRGESWRRLWARGNLLQIAIDPADSNRLYMLSEGVVFLSSDGGETVTPISVGAYEGFLFAISASGPGVVLAGAERGVFRSEDAGQGWVLSNLGIREAFVRSLAIDPADPAIVFAASSRGIYQSGDGGASWIEPSPQSPVAEVVAIDPSDRSTLYAAGGDGVQKSRDGGRTWQKTLVDHIADLVIDPSNPRRVLAASRNLYQSLDGGESWGTLMTAEDDYSSDYYTPQFTAVAFAPSNEATVYAGRSGDIGFVYRSDDGGNSWSEPTHLGDFFYVETLAINSCDPAVLYAGGYSGMQRSFDGGGTWSRSSLPENLPYSIGVRALAGDPRHSSSFFAGTDSGLFWTNDRGASWKRFEPALHESIASIALDPSGRFLYAGTARGVFRLERSFEPCADGQDRLCLIGAKYQVSVTARDRAGIQITGRAIAEGDSFGYFSFPDVTGDPDFPEVFVKMVNASGQPPPYGGHDWVFHSSLTDLDYTVTVLEADTGRVRTYEAGDSESLTCGRADTSAFERGCGAAAESFAASLPPAGIGAASDAELSLLNGRFRATIRASDPRTGRTADGTALAKGDRFGYFSLPSFTGDPSFPEIFVKMADATAQPGGYFWVFHTGLTDLNYTLTVTDQVTGAARTYSGGATDGTRLCGSADTSAFRN